MGADGMNSHEKVVGYRSVSPICKKGFLANLGNCSFKKKKRKSVRKGSPGYTVHLSVSGKKETNGRLGTVMSYIKSYKSKYSHALTELQPFVLTSEASR